jgi:hypothetical protein
MQTLPRASLLNSEFCILHYLQWHKAIDPIALGKKSATS